MPETRAERMKQETLENPTITGEQEDDAQHYKTPEPNSEAEPIKILWPGTPPPTAEEHNRFPKGRFR